MDFNVLLEEYGTPLEKIGLIGILPNVYRDRFPKMLGLDEGIEHFGPQIRILVNFRGLKLAGRDEQLFRDYQLVKFRDSRLTIGRQLGIRLATARRC